MHATPSLDSRVLTVAGFGLLVLAAVFGWRELEFEGVLIAVVGSGAALLFSFQRLDGAMRWLTPAVLAVAALVSAVAWLAFKLPLLLLGVALPVIGAAWVALRLTRSGSLPSLPSTTKELPLRLPEFLTWQTLGLGLVALTGGAYFHLLTLQVEDLARRLVLTLVWTLLGLAALFFSRKLSDTAPRDAGFVVLACAIAKVVLYDTTHLFGGLRVGVLFAVGALLLLGARVLKRLDAPEAS